MSHARPMPLRVTIVQPTLAAYRVAPFAELAARSGIDLHVVYASTPHLRNVEPAGFRGTFEPMKIVHLGRQPLYWQPSQWRYACRRHSDVLVLSQDVHHHLMQPAALLRARRNGVGTVLWGHGTTKHDSPRRSWPRRQVAKLADALLFYNGAARQAYLRHGFDPSRVFVAPNSLDQRPIQASREWWASRPEDVVSLRRALGGDGRGVVLFVSRLSDDRRVDLLIDAVGGIEPKPLLLIVGDGPARSALEARAQSQHVPARFVGAEYDEQKLGGYFAAADVFCFPSGMGLSLLHAMGHGVAVLTTDEPSVHGPEIEALRPGENGATFRDGNLDDLRVQLTALLADEPLRQRLAAAALRTVLERYTVPKMVDGLEAAIRCAAGRRGE